MSVRTFLRIKAVVSLLFGIEFVLIPGIGMGMLGGSLDPTGILLARLVGATLIGIGLMCWFGADADAEAQRGITLSLFIADGLGFIVALMGQMAGLMNALGWVIVAIWLLLALGNGYCRFIQLNPN